MLRWKQAIMPTLRNKRSSMQSERHSFKVLDSLVQSAKESATRFDKAVLLAVVPLLSHFERLLLCLQECGMQIGNVIGIDYASKEEIVSKLVHDIPSLTVPRFDLIDREVEEKLLRALVTCRKGDQKKLIILENGGYAVPILHKKFEQHAHLCMGAVEETKHGLWLDMQIEDLRIPVLTIADTPLKQLESPIIGRNIVQALEDQLNRIGMTVAGRKVCVLGFGSVGAALAKALRNMGSVVACYDIDPIKIVRARLAGYVTGEKQGLLRDVDIVIGATGKCSLTRQDIPNLKDYVFLASASSKRVEIALDDILSLATSREKISEHIDLYKLIDGKSIHIIGQGFPINFLLESLSCGPEEIFDLIVSDLFGCITELLKNKITPGIHRPPNELEERIAMLWLKSYQG